MREGSGGPSTSVTPAGGGWEGAREEQARRADGETEAAAAASSGAAARGPAGPLAVDGCCGWDLKGGGGGYVEAGGGATGGTGGLRSPLPSFASPPLRPSARPSARLPSLCPPATAPPPAPAARSALTRTRYPLRLQGSEAGLVEIVSPPPPSPYFGH